MAERLGTAFWPGVQKIFSCTYTIGHGTMPGSAALVFYDQPGLPAQHGMLIISDGVGTIKLPNCRVDEVKPSGSGKWMLLIYDRRWRWRDLGVVSGCYNQRDPRGNIYPWTLASVPDLMELCLKQMGESNYQLDLPTVVTSTEELLPAVEWDAVNPAQALTALADKVGCRVIYRLDTDTVLVAPVGKGDALPPGSFRSDSFSLKSPEAPDSILLVGAPIRYQFRAVLTAMALEWNNTLRPIDKVSYAPPAVSQKHEVAIQPADVTSGEIYTAYLNEIGISFTATASTVANVTAGLAAAISTAIAANSELSGMSATSTALKVTVFGDADGDPFDVETEASGNGVLEWELVKQGQKITNPWASGPPNFDNARATDRLSVVQAREFAKKSIYRYYQITNLDPTYWLDQANPKPLQIPGLDGQLVRIQQVLLQDTQVEQVLPEENDANLIGPDGIHPLDKPFYDGYSRDRQAQVFGSYCRPPGGVSNPKELTGGGVNSSPAAEVNIGFTIDKEKQCVIFEQPVYVLNKGRCQPAELVLQTACQVRDPVTNQVLRYSRSLVPPSAVAGTGPAVVHREDVQLNYLPTYNPISQAVESLASDVDRAQAMAEYYLVAEARRYDNSGGEERTYNGIVPVWLDGAIQQVTWEIGGGQAPRTVASLNSEHSTYVPSFPERLRLQFLPPAAQIAGGPPPRPEGRVEQESMYSGKRL